MEGIVERSAIVIAAFNEAAMIGTVVASCRRHYSMTIVVDDNSTDGTGAIARRSGAILLRHVINLGQGAALQTGIEFALASGALFIVTFDADGQHQIEDVEPMIAVLRRGDADVVLGSRFLGRAPGISLLRRALLKAAIALTGLTTGLRLTDAHNGLRAFNRAAAQTIRISQNRMAHASEIISLIAQHKLRVVELPVTVTYSEYSLRKGQKTRHALRVLADLFTAKLSR